MFKIGQKVVCKTTKAVNGILYGIIEGKIYIIENIIDCPTCGNKLLLLNIDLDINKHCSKCYNDKIPSNAFNSWRFEPIKYDFISNFEIIKEIIEERLDIPVKELENQN